MASSVGEIRSVCGYWLGPPCWFGSPKPSPIGIPGLPPEILAAYRRVLSSGGQAVVSANGIVLIDFASLDGPEPAPSEVAAAPFGDDSVKGAASVLAQRRVEILNAHQLCLLTVIGTRESDEDVWAPKPRPVHVGTLFHGWNDEKVRVPLEIARELLEFSDPEKNSTFQRSLFHVPPETVDQSFDMFEQLISGSVVAPRAGHLILHAAAHYFRWRFDHALIAAWTAAEALLGLLWARYIEERAVAEAANGYVLNSNRRDRLSGSDFTAAVVAEVLALAGVIGQVLFDDLATARSARNKWVHGLSPVSYRAAASAVESAERLLGLVTAVHLDAPLTLRESGL